MNFLEELETGTVFGDGAMATCLMESGIPAGTCFDELSVSQPEAVQALHERYIEAGARLIRTNSFGANELRLKKFGIQGRVNEINWSAAQLAKQTARGRGVHVAGSVGPLGLAPNEVPAVDRRGAFREQIGALLDGGVDAILLETFYDLEEIILALYIKNSLHHCPVICSLACDSQGRLPSGRPVQDALARLREEGADMVGVNCVAAEILPAIIDESHRDGLVSAYPSGGLPETVGATFRHRTTPEEFAVSAAQLVACGARLIGGCCGIGPKHIAAMVKSLQPRRQPDV